MPHNVVNVTRSCLADADDDVGLTSLASLRVVHHVVVNKLTVMSIIRRLTDSPHQQVVTLGNLTCVDIHFLEPFVTTIVLA